MTTQPNLVHETIRRLHFTLGCRLQWVHQPAFGLHPTLEAACESERMRDVFVSVLRECGFRADKRDGEYGIHYVTVKP